MKAASGHVPVLKDEVLHLLAPRAGGIYVDGTFGGGGYTRAILDAADCTVVAIDRDPEAVSRGEALATRYPGRLTVLAGNFADMDRLLSARAVAGVDGVALDLGLSSFQIDEGARGFSFRIEGPLDMRMSAQGESAADFVNGAAEGALADVIRRYGEERHAGRIARAIVAARREAPITRTEQLADIVRRAAPVAPADRHRIDAATRTFQALRIHVNDELGSLSRGLSAAERLLGEGGVLAVVSFHSLEDRAVKTFLRERSGGREAVSRHMPPAAAPAASFELVTRRPVVPGEAECAANPRARSARLRAGRRTAAPAWPEEARP